MCIRDRQQAPRTARAHHIEDAVDDLSHRPCTRPSRILRSRQVGLNHAPFLIGLVGLVSVRLADMLLSSGWGPHGVSGVGLSNPPGITPIPATQPLSTRPLKLAAAISRRLSSAPVSYTHLRAHETV